MHTSPHQTADRRLTPAGGVAAAPALSPLSLHADAASPPAEFRLESRDVGRALALCIAALFVADVVTQSLRVFTGHDFGFGMIRLFNMDQEASVPSWFSVLLEGACAALLWIIAIETRRARRPFLGHWVALAAGFTYISLDEQAQIHDEMIGVAMEQRFHLPGPLMVFVIPGAIIAVVVLLSFLSFLRHLPKRSRWLFLVAGVMYVGGAIGMESAGGLMVDHHGWQSWQVALCELIEETAEMAGVALFVYALLEYVERYMRPIAVRLGR